VIRTDLHKGISMNTNHLSPKRVAVVTGGARGIGLEIGKWFLANGYKVALIDVEVGTLDAAVKELARPDDLMGIDCDVSNFSQVQSASESILSKFGRIDALVNNAGVAIFKPVLETTFADWRTVMSTNLDGVFICSQLFGALMVKAGQGCIVNIASISGFRASTLRTAYGTSKAAVIQLTKQYAVELGNVNVRVNAVAPGPVETDMAKKVHTPEIRADYRDHIPLGRYGTTLEIAATVGFLCSDAASYINGQVIAVDGGFEATGVGVPTLRMDSNKTK